MTKDLLKRFQSKEIDIGGIGCPCCFNLSDKKGIFRRGRRRLKLYTKKEVHMYYIERS